MGRQRTLRASTIAFAAVLSLWMTIAAAGAAPSTLVHPVGLPVSLSIPAELSPTALPPSTRFYAVGNNSQLSVTVAPTRMLPFAQFASAAVNSARQYYLTTDPKATFRYRRLRLPAGESIEVIARYHYGSGGQRGVAIAYAYGFEYGGQAYDFIYTTNQAHLSAFLPLIAPSVRSIHFGH